MPVDTAHIQTLADQCVKCGLCLPECPTYRVARNEAESPRGRIAFAHALAGGRRELTPSLTTHLDQCLACMSCERVCPSQVHYGELIVATRALMRKSAPTHAGPGPLGWLARHPRALRVALAVPDLPLLRQSLDSRIGQRLLRALRLDRIVRERPHLPPVFRNRMLPTSPKPRARLGLFSGCVASAVDRDVHASAQQLLTALGYEVIVPHGQGCCGALALHEGDLDGAAELATTTRHAFERADVDFALVSTSGCFGTLRDQVFAESPVPARDIHEFIAQDEWLPKLKFKPLDATVALHTPCTQANVVRSGDTIRALLRRIPQLRVTSLPRPPGCCGAAGDYFLRHADIADTLRAETLDAATALSPDMLVTSNVGCRIFLDNGLRQRDLRMPVMHPIALLARQLDN